MQTLDWIRMNKTKRRLDDTHMLRIWTGAEETRLFQVFTLQIYNMVWVNDGRNLVWNMHKKTYVNWWLALIRRGQRYYNF